MSFFQVKHICIKIYYWYYITHSSMFLQSELHCEVSALNIKLYYNYWQILGTFTDASSKAALGDFLWPAELGGLDFSALWPLIEEFL